MSSISRPTMIINYSKIFSTLRVYNMFLLFHIPCITRVDTRFNRRLIEKQARERNEEGIEVIEDQKIIPTYVVSFQVIPSWNTFKSSKRGRGGGGGGGGESMGSQICTVYYLEIEHVTRTFPPRENKISTTRMRGIFPPCARSPIVIGKPVNWWEGKRRDYYA